MVKDHLPGMHDTLLMAMERISSSKILMDLECIKSYYSRAVFSVRYFAVIDDELAIFSEY